MVMVSNIVTGHSVLYTTEFKQVEQLLAYKKVGKNEYYLENTISRKKQLLPEILNILEQLYSIWFMLYKALARKYRPQNFDEIVGQEVIIETLKNAIRLNRISHAYLFCGPRGTGKN